MTDKQKYPEVFEVRQMLDAAGNGPVADPVGVGKRLQFAWEFFQGHCEGGMQASKLWRIESVEWNSPVLSFTIERHGGTVNGSSRAELQGWKLDFDSMQATLERGRFRQLYPRKTPLNVKPLAEEAAKLILASAKDERLKWHPDGRVRVLIESFVPDDCCQQTLGARRKRFRAAVSAIVEPVGWIVSSPNVWKHG